MNDMNNEFEFGDEWVSEIDWDHDPSDFSAWEVE